MMFYFELGGRGPPRMGNLSRPNDRVAPKGLPPGKRPPRGISFELTSYVIALH